MSWEDYHRRHRIINGVLADVVRSGRPVVPAHWHRSITETFGGEEAFLAALHYRWLNTLIARLEPIFEGSGDRAVSVRRVRRQLAAERPALWALLAAHADRPALARARAVEQQRCGRGPDHVWWADAAAAVAA